MKDEADAISSMGDLIPYRVVAKMEMLESVES